MAKIDKRTLKPLSTRCQKMDCPFFDKTNAVSKCTKFVDRNQCEISVMKQMRVSKIPTVHFVYIENNTEIKTCKPSNAKVTTTFSNNLSEVNCGKCLRVWPRILKQNETGLKVCKKCGTEKELKNFSKLPANPDGLHNYCMKCRVEYNGQHAAAKPELIKAVRQRTWAKHGEKRNKERQIKRATNPEFREKCVQKDKQYYDKVKFKPKNCTTCGKPIEVREKRVKYCRECLPKANSQYALKPDEGRKRQKIFRRRHAARLSAINKKHIAELSDSYVSSRIKTKAKIVKGMFPGLKFPVDILETERLLLSIKREIKQQNNGNT